MEKNNLKVIFHRRAEWLRNYSDEIYDKIITCLPPNIHSVKYRIKEFDSFFNKTLRKGYKNPLKQCTDILGFRIICLFHNQVESVRNSLDKQFNIIEDFERKKSCDQFSYQSRHIVCEMKGLRFEIQIRTILQEAWAEIEHYFNYKQIGIDEKNLRKINALAALFEIADSQFENIYNNYNDIKNKPLDSGDMTPEALYYYCKDKFPWAWKMPEQFNVENIEEYNKIVNFAAKKGISTIKQIDEAYKRNKDEIDKYDKYHVNEILDNPVQWPKIYEKVKKTNHFFSPIMILSIILKEMI
ncbi:MAG: GTP pyrophosphokinase [Nanobdellota archaeon]